MARKNRRVTGNAHATFACSPVVLVHMDQRVLRATAARDMRGKVAGGRERLEHLYRLHAPAAKRIAYLMTRNHETAEDLVQEAFVRVFRRFGDLNTSAFPTYLRRTVVNLTIDEARRERRRRARDPLINHPRHYDPSLEGAAAERDEVWQALAKIAPRQRAVLVLRYFEDLTEAQTADILWLRGVPVACVTSWFRELPGRSRMKKCIAVAVTASAAFGVPHAANAHRDVKLSICIPYYPGTECARRGEAPSYIYGSNVPIRGRAHPEHGGVVKIQRPEGLRSVRRVGASGCSSRQRASVGGCAASVS